MNEHVGDVPESNVSGSAGEVPEELMELFTGLQEQLAGRDAEIAGLKDQIVRMTADMQNARRRHAGEVVRLQQTAAKNLLEQLLPVLDNFERTIRAAESGASLEALLEGVRGVDKQFRSVLMSQNLERLEVVGQPFDPTIHDAIATEVTEDHPEDTVVAELEAGYRLADEVLRPARVKVAKKP